MINTRFYIIEGGKYLDWAVSVIDRTKKAQLEINKYVKKVGGVGYGLYFGRLDSVHFPERPALGFEKEGNNCFYQPRKNSKADKEIRALPHIPHVPSEWQDLTGCPTKIRTHKKDDPDHVMAFPIGTTTPIGLHYYDENGPFMIRMPNVSAYLFEFNLQHDDLNYVDGVEEWELDDDGLREICLEEWELMDPDAKTH